MGFVARVTVGLESEMLGLSGKEKIKINSDVNRAGMPVFIGQFKPHAFVD